MSTENENIPRRGYTKLLVPAEKAILDAIEQVECLPAHPDNTDAVILLYKAFHRVADSVDQLVIECQPPAEAENQTTPNHE